MSLITIVDMLRHGEPEGGEIFRGNIDVSLSESGWQQMHDALEGMQGWQKVISSPLQRCRNFSRQLADSREIVHEINENLREVSFGDWEGLLFTEVQEEYSEQFNAFWSDPINNTPPNAEPMLVFCRRIKQAFWTEVEKAAGQHILLVVHGGVIRAVLSDLLGGEPEALLRYEVPYACVTRIKIYHDANAGKMWPQLVFHNR